MLPSGALLINKPIGLTSSQVVGKIKWALTNAGYAEKGFKIGHGGTLDPFAIGALIVFIGEGTKLADTYLHSKKAYDGVITLGIAMDTGDLTGAVSAVSRVPHLALEDWQKFADEFVNQTYPQTPPMFSAKKRDGTPLYELARAGIEIEREPIVKKIFSFEIKTDEHPQELLFTVHCESGTYVRVLAEDLAKKAGTLAHLKTLRRIQSSDVGVSDCLTLDETLTEIEKKTPLAEFKNFRALAKIASHIPSLAIDSKSRDLLWQGIQHEGARLADACFEKYPEHRLVIARAEGIPVALFENLKNLSTFRLQRIFNEGRLHPSPGNNLREKSSEQG
jgi:tRNA pseudouridine55 synthase